MRTVAISLITIIISIATSFGWAAVVAVLVEDDADMAFSIIIGSTIIGSVITAIVGHLA